jgi:50S ribosomal protein L16 3-hydroxylase
MQASTLLRGLTPDRFLRRHWQKKPLLIRGARPGFRDPISPARLLALAARADVESRLVRERGGARKWEVTTARFRGR